MSAVSAGLFFGFSSTGWATSEPSGPETSTVVAAEGHGDKQQIQAGDTKPGGASQTGSTTGRDTGKPAEASDPSGLMGEATSATRTALASLGGTPSDSAATSERTGAESQASTGSRNPAPSEETGPSTSEAPEQSSEQAEVIAAPTAPEGPAAETPAADAPAAETGAAETAAEPTKTHHAQTADDSQDEQQDVRQVGSDVEPTATSEPTATYEEAPVPTLGSAVTDPAAQVAQTVRTLPTAVDESVDTTVAETGASVAPVDRATGGGVTGLLALTTPVVGSATGGLTHVTSPVADTVDTTGTRVQTVVASTAEVVGGVGQETGGVLCGVTGGAVPCVPGSGDSGDSGATLPGTDGAVTVPADGENAGEVPEAGGSFPVLLGGLAFPMLPRGSDDVATLQDTLQTSAEETPDRGALAGGLDQSVPTGEPRPMGPEGNGPGPVVGGAAPIASTLVDVRLPDAHHAAAVPAEAWRLPGSVTFEPGHSPD